MKPTFRKVYGYRDPNGVREIPETYPFSCIPASSVYETILNSERVDFALNLDVFFKRLFDVARARQEEVRQPIVPSRKPPQPMQDRIDRAFDTDANGDKRLLQNILDKVKRHS